MVVLMALVAMALGVTASWSQAVTLCRRGTRILARDGACKKKEVALSMSTSVATSTSDQRIIFDAGTGLEVTTGPNLIALEFVNHSATLPIHVRGVAMYNDTNTQFLDFDIAPTAQVLVEVAAAGTTWFDVLAVTRTAVADVQRFHAVCSFMDSATPSEVGWSCIGTR